MWDEQAGFFYDVGRLHPSGGTRASYGSKAKLTDERFAVRFEIRICRRLLPGCRSCSTTAAGGKPVDSRYPL